jgi:hypothetical protein
MASTAAIIDCTGVEFRGVTGDFDPEFITVDFTASFNGPSGMFGDRVVLARNTLAAAIRAAVRTRVNELLGDPSREPGVSITAANMQMRNFPV